MSQPTHGDFIWQGQAPAIQNNQIPIQSNSEPSSQNDTIVISAIVFIIILIIFFAVVFGIYYLKLRMAKKVFSR